MIDVYDIATKTWYRQQATGDIPPMRGNMCAVVTTASDGYISSSQVFIK
jgi:hypothetical protein